ncbi:THO complex subunit 7/Mft1 [Ostreococcus tauri]|uniref:THO complex subunit 7/Mft1 n=1 Tax=Ostreococcus tauri TaxID=70448 RepID=A0A090N2N2_OSTTA|nr:THO complex subunit 7/Mft1 [Ostreococcus tauri]CEF96533.1 THO complex subunit 7/Mft1 [Ostreococcus tauri]|eukprot:XP_022838148.1 THO complex subunit 7/Mft1 [Ostreococcus tauri]
MPPKTDNAPLVITTEEEEIIKQRIIEQTATLKPGQDYPLKRLVKTFFALMKALDAGADVDEAKETFLIELDTYEFNMLRYGTVVDAQRVQTLAYDDEEIELEQTTKRLKGQCKNLRSELAASERERAFREARDEAASACREYPTRAESEDANAQLERALAEAKIVLTGLDEKVAARKAKYALLLAVVDSLDTE